MRVFLAVLLFSTLAAAQQAPDVHAPVSSVPVNQMVAPAFTPTVGASPNIDSYTLAAGTHIPVVLKHAISTKSARENDPVYGETSFPVVSNGRIVIPTGTYVQGVIQRSQRPGRVKGRGELVIHFNTMIFSSGYMLLLPGAIDSVPGAETTKMKNGGRKYRKPEHNGQRCRNHRQDRRRRSSFRRGGYWQCERSRNRRFAGRRSRIGLGFSDPRPGRAPRKWYARGYGVGAPHHGATRPRKQELTTAHVRLVLQAAQYYAVNRRTITSIETAHSHEPLSRFLRDRILPLVRRREGRWPLLPFASRDAAAEQTRWRPPRRRSLRPASGLLREPVLRRCYGPCGRRPPPLWLSPLQCLPKCS